MHIVSSWLILNSAPSFRRSSSATTWPLSRSCEVISSTTAKCLKSKYPMGTRVFASSVCYSLSGLLFRSRALIQFGSSDEADAALSYDKTSFHSRIIDVELCDKPMPGASETVGTSSDTFILLYPAMFLLLIICLIFVPYFFTATVAFVVSTIIRFTFRRTLRARQASLEFSVEGPAGAPVVFFMHGSLPSPLNEPSLACLSPPSRGRALCAFPQWCLVMWEAD